MRDVQDQMGAEGVEVVEERRVREARRSAPRHEPTVTYPRSPSGQYVLRRDGAEVVRGSEDEIWRWLHDHHSYSVDHALRHEGYSIVPVESRTAQNRHLGEPRRLDSRLRGPRRGVRAPAGRRPRRR